jgi:hypothetical protein
MLRTLAKCLIGIGWAHPVLGLLAGFAPWMIFMGQPIPIWFPWERWLIYATPLLGLATDVLAGLVYLVAGHVILLLLDYGATLDGIQNGIRHLARVRQPQGHPRHARGSLARRANPAPARRLCEGMPYSSRLSGRDTNTGVEGGHAGRGGCVPNCHRGGGGGEHPRHQGIACHGRRAYIGAPPKTFMKA